jgi:serine/threonine-protein kinase
VRRRGPLPAPLGCALARHVAEALEHAHERGVRHRDVKPANVLLVPPAGSAPSGWPLGALDGAVAKLFDFSIARDAAPSALTVAGVAVGTCDTIAPEHILDGRRADPRADLYGLGCTLYFLLTGQVPYPGGGFRDKCRRHLRGERPALLDKLPPGPRGVVRHLMARDPGDRYQTAAEAAGALARCLRRPPPAS